MLPFSCGAEGGGGRGEDRVLPFPCKEAWAMMEVLGGGEGWGAWGGGATFLLLLFQHCKSEQLYMQQYGLSALTPETLQTLLLRPPPLPLPRDTATAATATATDATTSALVCMYAPPGCRA